MLFIEDLVPEPIQYNLVSWTVSVPNRVVRIKRFAIVFIGILTIYAFISFRMALIHFVVLGTYWTTYGSLAIVSCVMEIIAFKTAGHIKCIVYRTAIITDEHPWVLSSH